MYRFVLFSIQLIFLLIIISFVFTNPFVISLDISNLKYSFSSNFFAIVLILILLSFYLIFYFLFKTRLSLSHYFLKNKYKKLEKGYFYFVEAMIAISNKDNKNAVKSHKKMTNYLKDDPSLSLLLRSEVYKIESNYAKLKQVYESMLKSKKTETLGYRGLMEQNLKEQDYHHAFLYGEKLFNLNPNIEKLYDTLIYIAAKIKNWNQIILLTDKAYSSKIINKNVLQENKSIGYYEIASVKSESDYSDAIKNIVKALNLRNNFPPFIKLHLELVSKLNKPNSLRKLIKKYWNLNPNYLVRSIITKIIIDNNIGDLVFINQIIKHNSSHQESKKLLIYFAIQNEKWNIARSNISGLIGSRPSREICLFMSEIELGENSDKQKSDSWILRAENAFSENFWICKFTHKSQKEWNSLSETGHFNSLVLSDAEMIDTYNK